MESCRDGQPHGWHVAAFDPPGRIWQRGTAWLVCRICRQHTWFRTTSAGPHEEPTSPTEDA